MPINLIGTCDVHKHHTSDGAPFNNLPPFPSYLHSSTRTLVGEARFDYATEFSRTWDLAWGSEVVAAEVADQTPLVAGLVEHFGSQASRWPRTTDHRKKPARGPHTLKRSEQLADKIRWRHVLQCYHLLDVWDKGYIDIDEAMEMILQYKRHDMSLADFLLGVVKAVLPLVDSRGVVEKDVFLKVVKRWVDEDFSGTSAFSLLRNNTNPIATACKQDAPYLRMEQRPFYSGKFADCCYDKKWFGVCRCGTVTGTCGAAGGGRVRARHTQSSIMESRGLELRHPAAWSSGPGSSPPCHSPAVPMGEGLHEHGRASAKHKAETVERLRAQNQAKEVEECTFQPRLLRPFRVPVNKDAPPAAVWDSRTEQPPFGDHVGDIAGPHVVTLRETGPFPGRLGAHHAAQTQSPQYSFRPVGGQPRQAEADQQNMQDRWLIQHKCALGHGTSRRY